MAGLRVVGDSFKQYGGSVDAQLTVAAAHAGVQVGDTEGRTLEELAREF